MFQPKKQDQSTQKQLYEDDIGILPKKKKFKVMIIKMNQNLRKRIEAQVEKLQEIFNNELKDLKNKQAKMISIISE